MNLDRIDITNYIKREFKFGTQNVVCVEKFNLDNYFSYLNLKLQSDYNKNPIVYVMLIDPNNVLRMQYRSINSINNIFVGTDKNKCSIGTYPGDIISGEWKLIVVNLQRDKENRDYSIIIECMNKMNCENFDRLGDDIWVDCNKKDNNILSLSNYDWNKTFNIEKRWYKGDFHTHTTISDGKMDCKLYLKTAKEMKLDFAVSTEHNIIPTSWKKDNEMLVIPGTEITMFDGHFNILGLKKFPIDLDVENIKKSYENNNFYDFQENIVKEILYNKKNKEAIYSINHIVLEFWKWKFLNIEIDKFDTIEICNDPTYYLGTESNNRAIKILETLWNDGYRIYGIGGSDAHILPTETYDNSKERSIIGDPGTFVYCEKLTANNVIESVKQGHVYVSRGIVLDINIEVNDKCGIKTYLPGDEIEVEDNAQINYSININLENILNEYGEINKTTMPLKVYFIENGIKTEEIITKECRVDFKSYWNKEEYKYLNVEIRDMEDNFKAYINPIYHGTKEHEIITFEDLFKRI